jgi:PAS domain S-box-containing protein
MMGSYLLFHILAEMFSISVAGCVFAITWSTRIHRSRESSFFLLIGIASLFVGGMDIVHVLTYKGMNVIPGYDSNLPTQLWIASRYLHSLSFLAASGLLFLHKSGNVDLSTRASYGLLVGYAVITALLLAAIFARVFPVCFIEGSGLTPFKRISEYVICVILAGSAVLLWQSRGYFDREMLKTLLGAIVMSILSGLAFSLYTDVYGLFNMLGHILKVIVFLALYKAIVQIGIEKPYTLLARNLYDSEMRYRTIVENSKDALFIQDFKGNITDVNQNACSMLGYGRNELVGANLSTITAPDGRQYVSERMAALENNDILLFESEAVRKDGTRLPIEISVSMVSRDGDGMIYNLVRDITARKLAEAELRESEVQFRTIFEVASVGIVQADSMTGRILQCNQTYCQITGYPLSELVEISFPELVHPEDRQRDWDIFSRAARGETPVYFNEKRYIRKDGSIIWVRLNAAFVRDSKGQAIRTVAICEDITGRRRMGAYQELGREILQILNEPGDFQNSIQRVLTALKARTDFDAVGIRLEDGDDFTYFAQEGFSRDFLLTENTLVERAADGGVCRDKDGNVRLECTCGLVLSGKTDPTNPLFTPGGSCWTNDSATLLDIPSDAEPRFHPRNQCIHNGYASVALIPVRNQGRNVGLIQFNDRRKGCFTLDSVELLEGIASHIGAALMRKHAEENIRASLAEKEVLLKEVHHRVKNNLQVMSSLVSLQADSLADDRLQGVLNDVRGRIVTMALVHEKLYQADDLARLNFGEYAAGILQYLWRAHGPAAEKVRLNMSFAQLLLPPEMAVPCGLILNELASNAIKHAFPNDNGCEVSVSLAVDPATGAACLRVRDNGVGLPENFDWRQSTRSLGLRLVQMLAGQMRGTVQTGPGPGTEFEVNFTVNRL